MPAYFDSSVLISLLVGDKQSGRARELWHGEVERVSSILLDIECTTLLRRLGQAGSSFDRDEAEERLSLALEEITLKPVDEDVAETVRSTPGLSGCRTLDAVHLATALYFQAADPDLLVCTFDVRMAEVAGRVGLAVFGSS
jgi:predicted nucleic acid-binding protein